MSKSGSSTQYAKSRPNGTSARRHLKIGISGRRSMISCWRSASVERASGSGRGVEHEHAGDVTVDSRRLERQELRVEAGELAHGRRPTLAEPAENGQLSPIARACGIVRGCPRRSQPSRPPSWATGATRSSPAATRWSSTLSATSTASSSCCPSAAPGSPTCVETHIHNDYVSGGPELCRVTGATLVIPAGESVGYARQAIADGERIALGDVSLVARHTPGHTATHMTYVLEEDGQAVAAFTGGSMLLGSVGRTDLAGPWVTDRLSHLQHRSARRLSDELPDDAAILPTHGFGSLCSAGFPVGARGYRRRAPSACRESRRCSWTRTRSSPVWCRAWTPFPATTRTSRREIARERAGSTSSCRRCSDARELAERARAGEWVVDLRERRAFAARHLIGTLAFELSDPLTTYLGWLLPWGSPLSLIGRISPGPRGRAPRAGTDRHRQDRGVRPQRRRERRATRGPVWRPRPTRWSDSAI